MADSYADTFVGVNDGTAVPALQADGRRVGAERRVISAVITLAGQASGTTIFIGRRPRGSTYLGHRALTDTSLGTATIAIGTKASATKYKAAATFTSTDTPTDFVKTAQVAAAPLADYEDLWLTVGTAALPVGGTLIIDTNYCVAH